MMSKTSDGASLPPLARVSLMHMPGGPPTSTPLAGLACQGLFWRILQRIGRGKRREQMRKFCVRQSGRRKKLSWSVL